MSSFDTPAGSRGARRRGSAGPAARWVRQRMEAWHRRKGFRFLGMDLLVLTTIGARTGERRRSPLSWFPDGEDAWLIVASAGGSARNPAWYRNIAAHPDQVWIELPDRTLQVSAEQLSGVRREQCWQQITAAQPRYASYQAKTDRTLPVIRLVPAAP